MYNKIKTQTKDRFEKLSNNYGELFTEVFLEQGLNYKQFEESVFKAVKKIHPNFIDSSILDIGIGDGETSKSFLKAGCKKIVGIDLNSEMLEAAKNKLGDSIKLVQMDATKMKFKKKEFDIIITGATIHNIAKKYRINFWKELLRLSPNIFICAEKIADSNPKRHKAYYEREVNAIKNVYGIKHNLQQAKKEWLNHYKLDERERLDRNEIQENIGDEYNLEVVFEMGMYKTVVAIKK